MSAWHCKYSSKNKTTGHYECENQGQDPFAKIDKLRKAAKKQSTKLTALQSKLSKAEADTARMDWLEKESPNIYFNGAGHWVIDCGGDRVYSANTLTEAIDKAKGGE